VLLSGTVPGLCRRLGDSGFQGPRGEGELKGVLRRRVYDAGANEVTGATPDTVIDSGVEAPPTFSGPP
jgi:hypothetical protein